MTIISWTITQIMITSFVNAFVIYLEHVIQYCSCLCCTCDIFMWFTLFISILKLSNSGKSPCFETVVIFAWQLYFVVCKNFIYLSKNCVKELLIFFPDIYIPTRYCSKRIPFWRLCTWPKSTSFLIWPGRASTIWKRP